MFGVLPLREILSLSFVAQSTYVDTSAKTRLHFKCLLIFIIVTKQEYPALLIDLSSKISGYNISYSS